jgi:hypothetical protein
MSTKVIAIIFVVLVIGAGLLFFGGAVSAPTTDMPANEHMMPDGTMMPGSEASMMVDTEARMTHTMPDGTVMHMMPDGTMMAQ